MILYLLIFSILRGFLFSLMIWEAEYFNTDITSYKFYIL